MKHAQKGRTDSCCLLCFCFMFSIKIRHNCPCWEFNPGCPTHSNFWIIYNNKLLQTYYHSRCEQIRGCGGVIQTFTETEYFRWLIPFILSSVSYFTFFLTDSCDFFKYFFSSLNWYCLCNLLPQFTFSAVNSHPFSGLVIWRAQNEKRRCLIKYKDETLPRKDSYCISSLKAVLFNLLVKKIELISELIFPLHCPNLFLKRNKILKSSFHVAFFHPFAISVK